MEYEPILGEKEARPGERGCKGSIGKISFYSSILPDVSLSSNHTDPANISHYPEDFLRIYGRIEDGRQEGDEGSDREGEVRGTVAPAEARNKTTNVVNLSI